MHGKMSLWSLVAVMMVASWGCSSGIKGTEKETVTQTSSDVTILDTYQVTATIVAVDASKGTIQIQTPDGKKTTVRPQGDMPAVTVGDKFTITVMEQSVVEIVPAGSGTGASEAAGVMVAAQGKETDVMTVGTVQVTATVTAVSKRDRKVTLLFADGSSQTFKAHKNVDISKVSVGTNVDVAVTEAVAIDWKSA